MTPVYQVFLTASQRKIILDALSDRDSKLIARLKVCGPAERAKVLQEMGDHAAIALGLADANPVEIAS